MVYSYTHMAIVCVEGLIFIGRFCEVSKNVKSNGVSILPGNHYFENL